MRSDSSARPACLPSPECGDGLAELGRRARRGDTDALNQLLNALQGHVQRYLSRRLATTPDGEDQARDLGQEVLVRTAAALARCRFEDDRRLMAWVLTVARRILIDHVRARRARHEVVPRQELDELAARASLASWQNAPAAAGPCAPVAEAVAQAVASMPDATRELLRLRVHMGCTWKEVAAALDTTEAGAKRRFQRAQATLRARFREIVCSMAPGERKRLPGWAAELVGPC
jgi:RNA polymerase sigma-70 factor (ECF subfamily)